MILDTPAWVAWLESAAAVSFAYPVFDPTRGYMVGVMTVRKERRRRGGAYWVAYRRQAGHLRKVYLGVAATITRGGARGHQGVRRGRDPATGLSVPA